MYLQAYTFERKEDKTMKSIQHMVKTLLAAMIAVSCLMSAGVQALTLRLATDSGTKGSPAGKL